MPPALLSCPDLAAGFYTLALIAPAGMFASQPYLLELGEGTAVAISRGIAADTDSTLLTGHYPLSCYAGGCTLGAGSEPRA